MYLLPSTHCCSWSNHHCARRTPSVRLHPWGWAAQSEESLAVALVLAAACLARPAGLPLTLMVRPRRPTGPLAFLGLIRGPAAPVVSDTRKREQPANVPDQSALCCWVPVSLRLEGTVVASRSRSGFHL